MEYRLCSNGLDLSGPWSTPLVPVVNLLLSRKWVRRSTVKPTWKLVWCFLLTSETNSVTWRLHVYKEFQVRRVASVIAVALILVWFCFKGFIHLGKGVDSWNRRKRWLNRFSLFTFNAMFRNSRLYGFRFKTHAYWCYTLFHDVSILLIRGFVVILYGLNEGWLPQETKDKC